jgi:hypothetical protein
MRTWSTAGAPHLCGCCEHTIRAGDPMLTITLPGLSEARRNLLRCAKCADEPVPANLPPRAAPVLIAPMVHVASGAGTLPLDWKAQAAGERDPGQEG